MLCKSSCRGACMAMLAVVCISLGSLTVFSGSYLRRAPASASSEESDRGFICGSRGWSKCERVGTGILRDIVETALSDTFFILAGTSLQTPNGGAILLLQHSASFLV